MFIHTAKNTGCPTSSVGRRAGGTTGYVENKAGLTGQTVPGRRIPGHWPYPGPEELAEAELVGPDGWTFLSLAKVVLI